MPLIENPPACGSLVELSRGLWRPLIPKLDEASLRVMSFYAEEPLKQRSLYKAARETGLSFSTVYKRGRILASLRLLEQVGNMYKANSKTCIALYAYERLGAGRLRECLIDIWGLKGVSDAELLSFLTLLAYITQLRGLNITNVNICFFDEAALHVIRLYKVVSAYGVKPEKVVCKGVRGGDKPLTPLDVFSEIIGLPKDIVIPGLRLAVRGVAEIFPPTVATERHKIWLRLVDGSYKVVFVECKLRCRHFEEDLGLNCPTVVSEIEAHLGRRG